MYRFRFRRYKFLLTEKKIQTDAGHWSIPAARKARGGDIAAVLPISADGMFLIYRDTGKLQQREAV